MKPDKNWQQATMEKIQQKRGILTTKARKKYQLDLLERIVKRISEFSQSCSECLSLQARISELVASVSNQDQPGYGDMKSYRKKLRGLSHHLYKKHGLRPAGSMTAIGLTLGTAVGISLGNGMGNMGTGIALGTGIGIAMGAGLEARAKREGRTI